MGLLLLSPVTVTVEPIDSTQATDSLAREGTLQKVWGTAFTVQAQLDYAHRSTADGDQIGGANRTHRAELTVDRLEAVAASWQPRRGDRVTAATDGTGSADAAIFYVSRSIRRAYWFGGVPTTLVMELVDRFPARSAET